MQHPGTLVLANADWLAGLTIHQLKRPGAPFCSAGFTELLMDMRTTLWSYAAPEMLATVAAVADLAHWYGMPCWGLEMLSDTPQLNAQAGAELAMTAAWALLCNIELVHNAGLLGACKVCSAESSVLADEQIAYARRAVRPLPFAETDLSATAALIGQVGPGGDYMTHPDTLASFRSSGILRFTSGAILTPRQRRPAIARRSRLNGRRKLLAAHKPIPLPDAVRRSFSGLEMSWWARLAGG